MALRDDGDDDEAAPERPSVSTTTAEARTTAPGATATRKTAPGATRSDVPKIVGLGEARARAALRRRGFRVVVERVASVRPRGRVLEQVPAGGTTLRRGGTVALAVSRGRPAPAPAPRTAQVPGVLNIGFVDAANSVEQRGLVPDTHAVPSRRARGAVIRQRPEPGAIVRTGSTVVLAVAIGTGRRELATVPDVTGPMEYAARDAARRAGFTVRTKHRPAPSREEVGEVIFQQPPAGARAPVLTRVTVYVGR